jgi:hypothetical protein
MFQKCPKQILSLSPIKICFFKNYVALHGFRDVWVFLCPIYVQTVLTKVSVSVTRMQRKKIPLLMNFISDITQEKYSLHIGKRSRFGQQHGLQRITLTSYFYKNIYLKVIFVYFYKSIFQDKSINVVFIV